MKLALNELSIATQQGEVLVEQVNLTIKTGEIVALVGVSGSGKSLTCSALFGVLPRGLQHHMQLALDDQPVTPHAMRGRVMACIMQNPASAFNPVRTMAQHCQETLAAAGNTAENAIEQAMQDAGLENWQHILTLYPCQMSGGMLQRMMIALALMSQAPILIADEPTTDLDLVVQRHILDRLKAIAAARDLALLIVTHDLGVVAELADRVVVLHQGRVVESTTVEDLFFRPQHTLSQQLVQAHLAMYPEERNDRFYAG